MFQPLVSIVFNTKTKLLDFLFNLSYNENFYMYLIRVCCTIKHFHKLEYLWNFDKEVTIN